MKNIRNIAIILIILVGLLTDILFDILQLSYGQQCIISSLIIFIISFGLMYFIAKEKHIKIIYYIKYNWLWLTSVLIMFIIGIIFTYITQQETIIVIGNIIAIVLVLIFIWRKTNLLKNKHKELFYLFKALTLMLLLGCLFVCINFLVY